MHIRSSFCSAVTIIRNERLWSKISCRVTLVVRPALTGTCLLLATLLWPAVSDAQIRKEPSKASDEGICFSDDAAADAAIGSCGRLIASGVAGGRSLSLLHNQRGVAWLRKGEY